MREEKFSFCLASTMTFGKLLAAGSLIKPFRPQNLARHKGRRLVFVRKFRIPDA